MFFYQRPTKDDELIAASDTSKLSLLSEVDGDQPLADGTHPAAARRLKDSRLLEEDRVRPAGKARRVVRVELQKRRQQPGIALTDEQLLRASELAGLSSTELGTGTV